MTPSFNHTRLILFCLAFLCATPQLYAQTKKIKRPRSRVGIGSVDRFVRESFDIYDKVYKYDAYAQSGTPLDDGDIDVLEDALDDLTILSDSAPNILSDLEGQNAFKKGKATLQINKAQNALRYSIKTAKELLAGKEKPKDDDKGTEKSSDDEDPNNSNKDGKKDTSNASSDKTSNIEIWTKRYDFKPGKEIIFFDDFESEELGEIPSKWFYRKGTMEMIQVGNDHNMVMSGDLGYGHPNWEKGYTLPESYTIEFDIFLPDPNANPKGYGSYSYALYLYDSDYKHKLATIGIGHGTMSLRNITDGKVPNLTASDLANTWNHISISINKNSIKAYFNEYRLFNSRLEPGENPILFTMWNCCQTTEKPVFMIDNFKVAEGAHPKYKEDILKGKIVTQNINFETGSATIIPRSYAEVKRIADVMIANPGVTFSIEGHTDNQGSEDFNLELSNKRSDAVKKALIEMGIDADRMRTQGYGESQPIKENNTHEGRAMNRRVEFIKQ